MANYQTTVHTLFTTTHWAKRLFCLSFCCFFAVFAFAQKKNAAYQLPIKKASFPIKIDGVMDETAWQQAAVAGDFHMVLPMDTSRAQVKTDVRMTYDDNNLYIVAQNYNGLKGAHIVESLRRDFNFGKNDNFIFFLDPFNDQTNGFGFGANAVGAQWDILMFEGGKADISWDNKWESAVKNYPDRWVFEAAIPFKSIRYKKDALSWGINFSRNDLKTTEKSAWAPVPRQFPTSSMAFNGSIMWDKEPPTPKMNISAIPYATGSMAKDYANKKEAVTKADFGADAKIALNSSLNLDATYNPDFSQVEVDRQVTNLDRFELFFPERRQFFLENGDLFANFGFNSLRPFFSRRIGLNVPIQLGARLSGKLNKDWRIGAMNMQTAKVAASALPAQNFSVVALQRKVFSRSNIGAMFVNKESLNYSPETVASGLPKYSRYNRTAGLEYNLASANNLWSGKMLFFKSFSPNAVATGNDWMHAANLQYNSKKWAIEWQHEYVGAGYNAEVGFVRRRNYFKVNPRISYLFFPKSGSVLTHSITAFSTAYYNPKGTPTDNESVLVYNATFRNRATFMAWFANDYVQLLDPFDPTNTDKPKLTTGSKHIWYAWGTEFTSKPQSFLTYSFSSRYGGYFADGTRLSLTSEIGYRFQPYVSLAVATAYNDIKLPAPWNQTKFWLVGPRLDVTMTNKLFFTAFAQYNQQQKNINLNTRLQWRYQPASDLFIVYTDNYLPEPFGVKNRALVLKLTYWWNI